MLAPRSTLALTATALLTVTGALAAGAGPGQDKRKDLSVHVEIGNDHGRGDWGPAHRGYRPRPGVVLPPVVVQRPVVIERPVIVAPAPVMIDASPRTLDVQAFQAGGTVMILARGENTTAGFTPSLERQPDTRRDGVTRVTLHNIGPSYASAQACVPFAISGGFETPEQLNELRICIAGEERTIAVQRIEQIPRAY